MALLSVHSLRMRYGGPPLLDGVGFTLDRGERVCLMGRNGEGKSTLMRILAGRETSDGGGVAISGGGKVRYLPQEVPRDVAGTVREVVERGLGGEVHEPGTVRRMDQLFSELGLDAGQMFEELSGGQKRRVLLARALAEEPELLLLDEPTNHLDMASIRWMESTLRRFSGALLFVTHDRAFLRALATRILELDRGTLHDWDCDYDTYLRRRAEREAAEDKHAALQDKQLALEEAWLRQGVKARRTRNEGRVRALKKLREARRARRERAGVATLNAEEAERSGRKVIEVKGLTHQWEGGEPLIRDFSSRVMRGDKIGLIGPNGCGKTTLINLLLGRLAPQEGEVIHGTKLETLYYDQHRFQLKEDESLFENVGEGMDTVECNGQRRHVISYLEDFLFSPDRARAPVKVLSGGERNRLMLAKLFTRPSNVLVMDEPTNDLDLETLDLLESLLVEYSGTLLLVSHDRAFLNEVVTSTLAFEGEGVVREYPGGYDDYLTQRGRAAEAGGSGGRRERSAGGSTFSDGKGSKRLTNWEEGELEGLPGEIEALEAEIEAGNLRFADPGFHRLPAEEQQAFRAELDRMAETLSRRYARWEELEARA